VTRRLILAIAIAASLAGCDQSMDKQKKYDTYAPAGIFRNGSSAQEPPKGTVPQSEPARAAALKSPPQVTEALLERGRERFNIFCAPCHGFDGDGDGMVVKRGFPAPPSYHSKALMQAPASHFLDVIRNGYGVMYAYGDRVPPADRWAIVAYIRALQLSRHASVADARQAGVSLE
jgi:mono/diheme cytochrome c family protein